MIAFPVGISYIPYIFIYIQYSIYIQYILIIQYLKSIQITGKMDDYTEDVGPLLCSFYHDPLRPLPSCLVSYEADVYKLASNYFIRPLSLIQK